MEEALKVQPYPWNRLPTMPRESVGLLAAARRAIAGALDEGKIAEALSELIGERATVGLSAVSVEVEPAPSRGTSLVLSTPDDGVRVRLDLDRQLARALVSRVVGRPGGLGDPRVATPPEIEGAILAIVSAVARRAHGSSESLYPAGAGTWALAPGERYLSVRASVIIGTDAYSVWATVQLRRPFTAISSSPFDQLMSLGELPISMPVIAAVAAVPAGEMFGMTLNDVLLPGAGWTLRRRGESSHSTAAFTGEVILAAPGQARGIAGTLGENGEIVVVGVKATPLDAEASMTSQNQDEQTRTSEVILDAPLLVRVELGSVTMAAREWAALAAGDVIALGKRVSEPVVLRIAGSEVARGELVDIEGELGVRIRERVHST